MSLHQSCCVKQAPRASLGGAGGKQAAPGLCCSPCILFSISIPDFPMAPTSQQLFLSISCSQISVKRKGSPSERFEADYAGKAMGNRANIITGNGITVTQPGCGKAAASKQTSFPLIPAFCRSAEVFTVLCSAWCSSPAQGKRMLSLEQHPNLHLIVCRLTATHNLSNPNKQGSALAAPQRAQSLITFPQTCVVGFFLMFTRFYDG